VSVTVRNDPDWTNEATSGSAQTVQVWIKEFVMKNLVARFVKDQSGATAIEYGLIAAGISVAIIAVVQGLGTKLNTTFTSVKNALQ
jgi:pilus assembly protein Flp/PilA